MAEGRAAEEEDRGQGTGRTCGEGAPYQGTSNRCNTPHAADGSEDHGPLAKGHGVG